MSTHRHLRSAPPRAHDARRRRRAAIRRTARGFTLIELLVVVAIIALLLSILLPSLAAARESARTVVCGQQLRDLANGLHTYFSENNDWIPGVNTTGVAVWRSTGIPGGFYNSKMAVQTFDWITPLRGQTMELPVIRAKRFHEITNKFLCPSQRLYRSILYGLNQCDTDKQDFLNETEGWRAISYLMPAQFQYWGTDYEPIPANPRKIALAQHAANGATYYAQTVQTGWDWEAAHTTYKSRLGEVGSPAQKIAAADGTRYLSGDVLDFDVDPKPTFFGSFTSSGAWWFGSTEYGVKTPSLNWNNRSLPSSQDPPGKGMNLALSYRHGTQRGAGLSGTCQQNKGTMNAMFFDASVRRLNDKQSRNPVYWYPKGTVVKHANEGMIDDFKNLDVIP